MIKIFIYLGVSFILVFVLLVMVFLLSYSFDKSHLGKISPFECGFQPFSSLGVPFSVPFFVISLMFLLFDVEIILVRFLPFSFSGGFFSSYVY